MKNKLIYSACIFCLTLIALSFMLDMNLTFYQSLDLSWIWAINNLINNSQFVVGQDYAFTNGPLGFILNPQFYKNSFYYALLANLICIVVFVSNAILYFNKNYPTSAKKTLLLLPVFLVCFTIPLWDWLWNFTLLFTLMNIWDLSSRKEESLYIVPLSIIAGCLSGFTLVLKFSLAIIQLAISVLLGIILLIQNRKTFLKYFLAYSIPFISVIVLFIKLLFENSDNFINWIKISLEIADHFNSAMVIAGPHFYTILALIIFTIYGYLLWTTKKEFTKFFFTILLTLPMVFFVFKHGFVREDFSHTSVFFAVMQLITTLLFLYTPEKIIKKVFISLIAVAMLTSSSMIFNFTNSNYTIDIDKDKLIIKNVFSKINNIFNFRTNFQKSLQKKEKVLTSLVLPKDWNELIKDDSIKILPNTLVYAEANQWKNWQPNPTLQLYSAYSQILDEISANSFLKAKYPQFVFVEFMAIDRRNMFLDNPRTWHTILENYEIVKHDNERMLLIRKTVPGKGHFEKISSMQYKFNEWIEIPSSANNIYAIINTDISIFGKIATFLFRGCPSDIMLHYKDGKRKFYRVINDTLKSETLINYVPFDFEQTRMLFENHNNDKFKVIKIKFINQCPCYYKNMIKIDWLKKAD